MNKKYYVISICAEDNYAHIVSMTDEEAKAVEYALDYKNSIERAGGGWCGSCYISEPYDTIEQARERMNEIVY